MPERILVTGGPRTGKTTWSNNTGSQKRVPVFHTDDYIDPADWHACSELSSHLLDTQGPWIIEGVAVPRALRKWLRRKYQAQYHGAPIHLADQQWDVGALRWARRTKLAPPCDKLIVLTRPYEHRCEGQRRMAEGVHTVLTPLIDWLGKAVEHR